MNIHIPVLLIEMIGGIIVIVLSAVGGFIFFAWIASRSWRPPW